MNELMLNNKSLFESTFFLMTNMKWILLVSISILGLFLKPWIERLIFKIRNTALKTQKANSIGFYLLRLESDFLISQLLLMLFWSSSLESIEPHKVIEKYLGGFLKLLLAYYLIRIVYLAVNAVGDLLQDFASKTTTGLDDQLAPFATKTIKVLVIILGGLLTLQNFGVNVGSLLAGLGLGGLAFALAAQDTAANLFGSITILFDSPFKIGDHIKIGDTEGTVEDIGFRSTRIRAFTNSLITLPNSIVSKEKIENLGIRGARRVRQVLGVHYDTTPEQITHFCDEIKYLLKSEKLVNPENIVVYFNNYNAATLDILVNFHLQSNDPALEAEYTQKLLGEIWKIAKKLNIEFAYPTQTLYLKQT